MVPMLGLRRWLTSVVAVFTLVACASYSGRGLVPGQSMLPDIIATMGEPAMRWKESDGRVQLAYPRGPAGVHTFMVFIAADGRLEGIRQVLDMSHFARIESGKSMQSDVLRLLGPSDSNGTAYFAARNELVWEWRFCDSWNQVARFAVLFDATTGVVRSTLQQPELSGWDGVAPACGHWYGNF